MRHRRCTLALAIAVAILLGCSSPAPAWGAPMITAASDGHSSHPVWYHDSVAVRVGPHLFVSWNTNRGSIEVRAWSVKKAMWLTRRRRISATVLDCGCTDSTGTNPNRHDVPALFADTAGRVYALYGGGTASRTESKTGPFFRAAAAPGSISSWGPEQRLSFPGAVYDFEVVRNNLGENFAIGQQGDNPNGAGSLVLLAISPGTTTIPAVPDQPIVLVQGGKDPSACGWRVKPGCDIFVIGRIAVGPHDPANPAAPAPLYVVWGWSEANLSNTCGDPAGFCNHGLYFAKSLDGGSTWSSSDGSTVVSPSSTPIPYDDARFEVVRPSIDVGLFKALAVTGAFPGTVSVVYQRGADIGMGRIAVRSLDTSAPSPAWTSPTVIDRGRSWNNHLVVRATPSGRLYLWSDIAQTGTKSGSMMQWTTPSTSSVWSRTVLSVGLNWYLTGVRAGPDEALLWRAPIDATRTAVRLRLIPTA